MVTTPIYLCFLALIGLERINEMRVASANARRAFADGGIESGRTHYRVMVVVHALFLPSCAAEVIFLHRPFPTVIGWLALALVLGAQALRAIAMHALGERWNTRIIVVPGAPLVTTGPYRYIRHPNYVAVVLEMACIPLIHGAWITALVFSAANAILLTVRIRAEEAALGRPWSLAFQEKGRFVPGGPHA